MQIYNGPGWHVEFVGMPALNRKLAAIGEAWEQAADDATREIADETLAAAQARVKVKSGDLRASGKVVRLERHQYAVVFDKPYAARIEFGFHGTDSLGRKYNQAAQPYLRPAWEEKRATAMERTADLLQRAQARAAA
jgi:hypothetical protein